MRSFALFALFAFSNATLGRNNLRGATRPATAIGNQVRLQCPDGHNVTCHEGTQGCMPNSTFLCNQEVNGTQWGNDTTIYCDHAIPVHCQAGTHDCYNNSKLYCHSIGGTIMIHCGSYATKTCHIGSYGCFDNSKVYCAAVAK